MGVMPRRSSGFVFALVCLLVIGETWLIIGGSASASVDGTYYFSGNADDQAQKDSCFLAGGGVPAPCTPPGFSKEAPTSGSSIQQTSTSGCLSTFAYDPFCAYWVGEYSGQIDGNVEICWFWSSTNPAHIEAGVLPVNVFFFADPVNDLSDQEAKIIGQATVEVAIGTPDAPAQTASVIPVKGKPTTELMISVGVEGGDADQGPVVHYGSTEHPSAFGRPGTVCPGDGTPTQTSTATSPPSQTTNATSPGVRLRVSDSTPERGTVVKAKGSLKKCEGHKGTKLQLQKKKSGTFRKVAVKQLNNRCRATFRIRARFKKATFRAFWPKQDEDHKAGRSKPRTIRTHR